MRVNTVANGVQQCGGLGVGTVLPHALDNAMDGGVKPSKLGATVEATATLTKVDRRKLSFHVVAKENGEVIGEGEHLRFIVDRQRFMQG